MQLKDIKTVTKIVNSKLEKQSKKQKLLEQKEQEELEQLPPVAEQEEEPTETPANSSTIFTTKNVVFALAAAAIVGGLYKEFTKDNN